MAAAARPAATSWPAGVSRRASRYCSPDTPRKLRYQNRRTTSGGNRDRFDDLLDDGHRGRAREARLRIEREAMRDDRHRQLLHVLGHHELLAVEERQRLGGADDG